jgi:predicted nuclease of predicted toxin-antitoxin system
MLGEVLRQRGYDVIHVLEVDRGGKNDPEQLDYAVSQGRAILTHNIRDYLALDRAYRAAGKDHYGIIVSDQVPLRELLRRTLRFVNQRSADEIRRNVITDPCVPIAGCD